LELLATERREVDGQADFAFPIASPADSVSLVVLQALP
jgi:hypothetical protein